MARNILDVNFLYPDYEIALRSESDGNLRIMKQLGGISDLGHKVIKIRRASKDGKSLLI